MKRPWGRDIAVLALSLMVAGCSPGSPGTTAESRAVEMAQVRLLSTSATFVHVRDATLDEGALWVLDGAPPFVTRLELEDGRFLRFGTEGEGPGELLDPWAIQPALDSGNAGIVVWDLGQGVVSAFGRRGAFLGAERLSSEGRIRIRSNIREVSYGDPVRVRNNGRAFLVGRFPRRVDRTGDLAEGVLIQADRYLDPGPELARFSDHTTSEVPFLKEWAALPLWDACDGTAVLWSPRLGEVAWMDSAGATLAKAAVEVPPSPVTLQDIERYLRWMARLEMGPEYDQAGIDFTALARAYRGQFAEDRPVATDLRCASRGEAWIRLFDTATDPLGKGAGWLRISADGTTEGFEFPVEFDPMVFTPRGVYGTLEVSQGHQVMAWWPRGRAE